MSLKGIKENSMPKGPQLKILSLVFRKLTDADFFNINKPAGVELRGGGQSYIDFPTSAVTLANWTRFFTGVPKTIGPSGPIWRPTVRSLGTNQLPQKITIAQRRDASVSIRSQKLLSSASERVHSWNPGFTGFPAPANPKVRSHIYDLHIYIVRLENNEYWAGWFQTSKPEPNWSINGTLNKMFTEEAGYLAFNGNVLFDPTDPVWPFRISPASTEPVEPTVPTTSPGEVDPEEKAFFDADEAAGQDAAPVIKEKVRKVRMRNTKAVKKLKALYGNRCQVSGEKYTFRKLDGSLYSEAHHLVPLGKGGSDSVYNIVIISPLVHRMFHYAKVDGLDLTHIKNNQLQIKVNDVDFVITWHPEHAKIVQASS